MSANEGSQPQQQQQWPQLNYMRLLDSLFQKETPHTLVENAFKFFESNFTNQPNLINILCDYYFIYGINTLVDYSNTNTNFAYEMNIASNSKSIIDLICLIPDNLCNNLFAKILEFMNKFPMHLPQPHSHYQKNCINYTNFFERVTNLLILICYRKKNWLDKLANHQLLNNVIRVLKTNSNQTELITVHTCLLFVLLLNSQATQMLNNHAESLFQIFIYLFNYQITLEKRSNINEIVLSNVKWSIRLYFYVCYGLNAYQLIQYLKKKDPTILSKESFNQMFFYLRINPTLLKDKSDSDKQSKQASDQANQSKSPKDFSLEWRKYCLDPMCTNYNQVIQNMQKSSVGKTSDSHLTISNSNNVPSIEQFNNLLTLQNNLPLLSPSLFTSKSKQNQSPQVQMSNSQITSTQAFHYPSSPLNLNSDNQTEINIETPGCGCNSTIKNLTTQFMMSDKPSNLIASSVTDCQYQIENISVINTTQKLLKSKSKSDSNLYYDFNIESKLPKTMPSQRCKNTEKIIPPLLLHSAKLDPENHYRTKNSLENQYNIISKRRLTSSDIRDAKISQSALKMDQFITSLSSSLATSESNIEQSCPLKREKKLESNDVIKAYFKNVSMLKPEFETVQNDSLHTIGKLREEMNHLVLQLIYERHLREKYEEDVNQLHFYQIERNQLLEEKRASEGKLTKLVEQYKNEVEESLKSQNNLEISAYKEELRDKNSLIESLQLKLEVNSAEVKELREKFDDLKLDYKKIQKECNESVQALIKEQNIKTKHEIDHQYINSLRYTTDVLRKKILLMSKSHFNLKQQQQQQSEISMNQDLADIIQLCNSSMSLGIDQIDQIKSNNSKTNQTLKLDRSLFNFQQTTIESLKQEIEDLQKSYNNLLKSYNAKVVELEDCKRSLDLRDAKVDELNQSIQIDSIEMNAEIMKNQYRVYSSLMNVNKRLEEEILKLKANLNEKTLRIAKLEKKNSDQTLEMQHLLDNFRNMSKENISQSMFIGVS